MAKNSEHPEKLGELIYTNNLGIHMLTLSNIFL